MRFSAAALSLLGLMASTTGVALWGAEAKTAGPSRPNIVFILADDLGWTDLGVQGSKYYETPAIDRLAAQGMRLTSFHTCQNCAPTRASLISGQYGPRTGIYMVGSIDRFDWQNRPLRPVDNVEDLPSDKITIAQVLKQAGYATGMFGKWHLGQDGIYHPSQRGFDEAIVTTGGHFHFKTHPEVDYPPGIYLADWLTEKAVDFIERYKDEPFFLYLCHFAVHAPIQAKPEWITHFQAKPGVGGHKNPVYAAMIASVDESVSRVMAQLDRLHLADNTVVIFSSDNGGVYGYVRGRSEDITDNAPLRNAKGSLYEGGTRVPVIVRWPGVTRPGSLCDVPAIHVDFYPTLAEIAGAQRPAGYTLDGESLVPLLRNPDAQLQREAIYQHFPGYLGFLPGGLQWRTTTTPVGAIQSGDWKLMEFFEDGRLELYNLRDDIGETNNLAEKMPDKAGELHARLAAWRASIQAPMPTRNVGTR